MLSDDPVCAAEKVAKRCFAEDGPTNAAGRTGLGVEAVESFQGSWATDDFYAIAGVRNSIDGHGLSLDPAIHDLRGFDNALWNGRPMVCGDGDGKLFNRFTSSLEVIAHDLTHCVTQYTARLVYDGRGGALSEHISGVFDIMVKQYSLGRSANASD